MGGVREEAKKLEEDGGTIAGVCKHGDLTKSEGGVGEGGSGCDTLNSTTVIAHNRHLGTM
jgi:hypothetical protein